MAELAGERDGVVSRDELAAAGLTRDAIAHRVARGRLLPLHPGVFAVGHRAVSLRGHARAALLTCGRGAVLTHGVTAHLWDFAPAPALPLHVTVPRDRRVVRSGVRVHHAALGDHEVTVRDGLTMTTPARTIVDLAAIVPPRELERLLAEAFARRRVTRAALLGALADRPRGRGTRLLRRLLDEGAERTRSAPERTLLRLVRAGGLPAPAVNARVGPWLVDLLWREQRVAVELDAYSTHSSPWAFERDRRKDAALRALGLDVVRVTRRQVDEQPEVVLVAVVRALAATRTPLTS